jgi:TolB protein
MFCFGLIALASLLACASAEAQDNSAPLRIFEGQNEEGNVLHPDSAKYNATTRTYTVSGSGENMWFSTDEFHFVWKRRRRPSQRLVDDQQSLNGRLRLRGCSAAWRRPDFASIPRPDGGAATREIESSMSGPARLRIEKQGDRFYLWTAGEKEDLQFAAVPRGLRYMPLFTSALAYVLTTGTPLRRLHSQM